MNVCAALVANAQSPKAVKPTKGALNDPTPAAKPFTRLDRTERYVRRCLAGAAKRDVLVTRKRDPHVVSPGVCELDLATLARQGLRP